MAETLLAVGVAKEVAKTAVQRFGILIVAFIALVAGIILWGFLAMYHLTTAFAGMIGGLLMLWFFVNMLKINLNEHPKYLLTPIVLAIVGLVVEYFNIWKVPFNITIPKNELTGSEITMSLQMLFLAITTICVVAQTLIVYKNKR